MDCLNKLRSYELVVHRTVDHGKTYLWDSDNNVIVFRFGLIERKIGSKNDYFLWELLPIRKEIKRSESTFARNYFLRLVKYHCV